MAFPMKKVLRSGSLTTSENSTPADIWDFDDGSFVAILEVEHVAGTDATLDVNFQTTPDRGTTWVDLPNAAFQQVGTTDRNEALTLGNAGEQVRAVFTVGGTDPEYNATLALVGRGSR